MVPSQRFQPLHPANQPAAAMPNDSAPLHFIWSTQRHVSTPAAPKFIVTPMKTDQASFPVWFNRTAMTLRPCHVAFCMFKHSRPTRGEPSPAGNSLDQIFSPSAVQATVIDWLAGGTQLFMRFQVCFLDPTDRGYGIWRRRPR